MKERDFGGSSMSPGQIEYKTYMEKVKWYKSKLEDGNEGEWEGNGYENII